MTKNEFKRYMVDAGYFTSMKDAGMVIDAVTESISRALVEGESIVLNGFGTFELRERVEKDVVMQNGERIRVPAHYGVKFNPGKVLKRQVREGFVRQK